MIVESNISRVSPHLLAARLHWFAQRRAAIGLARCLYRNLHVIQPRNFDFVYIPIPKNACTTIKTALFALDAPPKNTATYNWRREHVHRYFHGKHSAWRTVNEVKQQISFRFTVIRHPFDRFVSAYRNRVLRFRDLENDPLAKLKAKLKGLELRPSMEYFAAHLSEYAAISGSIAHHTRPQAQFIIDRRILDAVYTINELDSLTRDLNTRFGVATNFEHKNRSQDVPVDISSELRTLLNEYYLADFEMFPELKTLSEGY